MDAASQKSQPHKHDERSVSTTQDNELPMPKTLDKRPSEGHSQLWAYLLIGLGLVSLGANVGLLDFITSWLWALLFIVGGGGLLMVYQRDRRHWWTLIPGFALLALGVATMGGSAMGGLFLGLIGTGFAAVYLSNHTRWWAIIQAGVLFTLALVAWLDALWPGSDSGWLFFLGIALTFGVLFFLPQGEGKQGWALYPALITLAFVVLTSLSGALGAVVVPLLLVLAGIFMLWRQREPNGTPRPPVKEV